MAKIVGWVPWIRQKKVPCYKTKYSDVQEAYAAIRRMRGIKRKKQRVYKCSHCNKWHTTSHEEWSKK